MQMLWQDIRYGARMLVKNPGFAVVAAITLALGIGANTAIFSVVYAVMLRPLPYIDAQRFVVIESGNRESDSSKFGGISPADFWDYKEQATALEQVAALRGDGFAITGIDNPETVPAQGVSTNFFQALKAKPLLGNLFTEEDAVASTSQKVVLSNKLWQRRFGGDPDIVGKTIGDTGAVVIGVMPKDFNFPAGVELWMPLSPQSPEMKNRANRYMSVVGLLKEGQSIESAQSEMQTIASRLETQYPKTNENITIRLTAFREWLVRDVKTSLAILFGSVGLVLLIACANVASLSLTRATSRRKEIAIRLALGANRWHIIRQLLTESLLLSILSAAGGLLIASWGIDVLIRFLPESYAYLQLGEEVRIDSTVFLFTLCAGLAIGVLFGIYPALQSSRPDVNEYLKEGGKSSSSLETQRARSLFVIAEIAIALVLLVGAGLLMRSFIHLQNTELGFDPANLFSANFSASFAKYPTDRARAEFYRQMAERVSETPGIEDAAISSGTPFAYLHFGFNIEGNLLPQNVDALYDSVSSNYFQVVKAHLLEGRQFTDADTFNTAPVAIVNESFSKQIFAGESALGKRVTFNYLGKPLTREVVGVVDDFNQGEAGKVLPQLFVPCQQQPWLSATMIIRSKSNPASVRNDVQNAIWSIDKTQTPFTPRLFEEQLSRSLAEPRLYTSLLGLFASLAFVLAIVGIYSVMAYTVAQSKREIGIRMALGAQRSDVMKQVLGQGMKLVIIGILSGTVGAYALTGLIKSLLFGVTANDPLTFALVALILAAVALGACFVPARRATRVDPMIALRYE